MKISLRFFSFRFAEQVSNSKLALKQEIEDILTDPDVNISTLSRPIYNSTLRKLFTEKGWISEAPVFEEADNPSARLDFLKERIGIEVGFGHSSFLDIDLLIFQVSSYSGLDKIDVGVYIVTTRDFQKLMKKEYNQNWEGSLTFLKVVKYLPHFKGAIQVPIYVICIDLKSCALGITAGIRCAPFGYSAFGAWIWVYYLVRDDIG